MKGRGTVGTRREETLFVKPLALGTDLQTAKCTMMSIPKRSARGPGARRDTADHISSTRLPEEATASLCFGDTSRVPQQKDAWVVP